MSNIYIRNYSSNWKQFLLFYFAYVYMYIIDIYKIYLNRISTDTCK